MKIKRKPKIVAFVLIVIVVVAGAMKFAFVKTEYNFTTVKVGMGSVSNTITATGTLEATETVEVGCQVSGVVEKLYVDFNSKVTKGQLIAELDKSTLQLTLVNAEADLERAQAQLEYQKANYERNKVLYDKKLLAKSDYDLIVYNYKTSSTEVKKAKANLNKAQRNLSYASIYSPIDGIVLNRAVEEGQTVTASMNTPELYTITNDLSTMRVEADIDEADIGQLQEGQRVEFTVDAFPELTFDGQITEIRLQPTESSNVITYTTIVTVRNPDLKLKPGMTASITVYVEEVINAVVLEAKALRFTPDREMIQDYIKSLPEEMQIQLGRPKKDMGRAQEAGMQQTNGDRIQRAGGARQGRPMLNESKKRIWVKEGDAIRPVIIEIGIDDGTNVEVISGLNTGDEAITSMTLSTPGSSNADKAVNDKQKSPFVQERPGRKGGGGAPR